MLPGRRSKELLAALAIRVDTPVRRDALRSFIWPESDERAARKALNTEVWRLKGALQAAGAAPQDWLSWTTETLWLRTDRGLQVDYKHF